MSTMSHPWFHLARRAGTVLAAAGLLAAGAALVGCTSAPSAPATVDSRLVAGWEANARPLFMRGPGPTAGTQAWLVPATLPRGTYELVSRRDGGARVIDGRRFEVDGQPYKDLVLILPSEAHDVEAVEARFVSAPAR
ncbi:MAG: hypothetical protein HY856_15195 [Burkholderiales bacterium]|nr:hypothetical protein [Burkholderiales bacterium]